VALFYFFFNTSFKYTPGDDGSSPFLILMEEGIICLIVIPAQAGIQNFS